MRPALCPNEMPGGERAAGDFLSGTCHDTNFTLRCTGPSGSWWRSPYDESTSPGMGISSCACPAQPLAITELARFSLAVAASTAIFIANGSSLPIDSAIPMLRRLAALAHTVQGLHKPKTGISMPSGTGRYFAQAREMWFRRPSGSGDNMALSVDFRRA